MTILKKLGLLLILSLALSACGQKGPLIVDLPVEQQKASPADETEAGPEGDDAQLKVGDEVPLENTAETDADTE